MRFDESGLEPCDGSEPYIFVSYSHDNRKEAREIIAGLKAAGYRLWYDEGVRPGTEWDDDIAKRVKSCGLFLALISADYIESDNCRDELKYARDCKKHHLLIYLEPVQLQDGMEMPVS